MVSYCMVLKYFNYIHYYLLVSLTIIIITIIEGLHEELNKFHIYETEKITRKASDVAEYIESFGSFTPDRHARHI